MFDTAGSIMLIDLKHGRELRRELRSLDQNELLARAEEFLKLEADVLLCGAISAPLEALLVSSGVHVIGFLCGPVDEVLTAFLNGDIGKPKFLMPGCRAWRRRLGQIRRRVMAGGFGMGSGGGRNRRGRGGGRGRMGGPSAAGPGGTCVCPKCGEKAPHTAGQPCNQMVCPKCGTPMVRA